MCGCRGCKEKRVYQTEFVLVHPRYFGWVRDCGGLRGRRLVRIRIRLWALRQERRLWLSWRRGVSFQPWEPFRLLEPCRQLFFAAFLGAAFFLAGVSSTLRFSSSFLPWATAARVSCSSLRCSRLLRIDCSSLLSISISEF